MIENPSAKVSSDYLSLFGLFNAQSTSHIYIYIYIYIRGAFNKFPDFL